MTRADRTKITAFPAVSPDGRWLAFMSTQSGQSQVYVRPLRGQADQVQVSVSGGTEPMWSRDGREIFYRTGAGLGSELIQVAFGTDPEFSRACAHPPLVQ